jgi:hypothetical protein
LQETKGILDQPDWYSYDNFSHLTDFENRELLFCRLAQLGYGTKEFWESVDRANRITSLSCVPLRYRSELVHAKNLTTLITMLTDDEGTRKDRGIPRMVTSIVLSKLKGNPLIFDASDPDLLLAASSWDEVMSTLEGAPLFEEFRDMLLLDMGELLRCQRFYFVIGTDPLLCNADEYLAYGTHCLNLKPHTTMDLMFSPDFRMEDLGPFRRALRHLQTGIQLVNDTHIVETSNGSFRDYLVIRGMDSTGTSVDSVYRIRAFKVEKTYPLRDFEGNWEHHIEEAKDLLSRTDSFDIDTFVETFCKIRKLYEVAKRRI